MCNHPEDINKYLNYREKVYYTGNYDITAATTSGDTNTVPCNISRNINGYNLCPIRFAYVKDVFKPDWTFLWEQYSITSWDFSLLYKIGQIDFSGTYLDSGSLGVTTESIQVFAVGAANGIYKNIHKIIIDFRAAVRNIYFVGYTDFA